MLVYKCEICFYFWLFLPLFLDVRLGLIYFNWLPCFSSKCWKIVHNIIINVLILILKNATNINNLNAAQCFRLLFMYLFQKNYLNLPTETNYLLCTDLLFYKNSKKRLEILDEKLAKNSEALPKTEKRITRGIFVAVFSACCKTTMF